jgi:phosphonate transport system substrate-binding protein
LRAFRIPGWFRVALVALCATVLAAACSSASGSTAGGSGNNKVHPGWPTSLTFASVGAENASSLLQSLAPLQKVLEAKLGIHLTVYTGTSYAAVIEAQEAGKAQLVQYGPFSYVIALNQGLKIQDVGILTSAPDTNGGYYSLGVVNPKLNPQITSIKDFKGKKTCFSDPSSTSGYLYPSAALLGAGISPTTGVTPVFAGTDSTSPLDVAKGSCQVGFSNNMDMPVIFTQNHIPHSDIKIVWTSQQIPGNPMVVSDSLPASFRSALENVLINDGNSAYEAAHHYCSSVTACTSETGQYGFAPPSVANFSQVTQVCQITKSPSCKLS